MTKLSTRKYYFISFIVSLAVISLAYLLQYIYKLEPCPLCLIERYTLILLCAILFISFIHNSKSILKYLYSFLGIIISLFGLLVSIRHVWLQMLPEDKVPACTAGMERLMKIHSSLFEVLKIVLKGSGDCAKVEFAIFGVSLAWLSLAVFLSLFLIISFIFYLQIKKRRD